MTLFLRCELIAIFVYPFFLMFLRRRGAITEKQMAFTSATLLSFFFGSLFISLGKPETLFAVPIKDWLVAIPFTLFFWVCFYIFSLWISKHMF